MDLIKLVDVLNKTKWYIIITSVLLFLIYTFQNEIKRIIDLRILKEDVVINTINDDVIIETALNDLMMVTNADRAYIFRFHNGVSYYNGSHKSKMSCDYETVKIGISREAERLQDVPTGLYSRWLKDVIEYKMFITDLEQLEDLRTKKALELQGITGLAVVPYYRDGKIFALIGVDYVRNISQEESIFFNKNRREQINKFKNLCNNIGDLLN